MFIMDVLIVGYGKIGRIKAFIWHSLGRSVYVHDTNDAKRRLVVEDGFMLHSRNDYSEDLIVDISTPASYHVSSLEWVLGSAKPEPRTVLIEKPLVSDEQEEQALKVLLSKKGMTKYKDKIIVNESYYLSSALRFVVDDIASKSLRVTEVHAELSKNRMEDVVNGRFVDENLGSLGIELPHMIAMAQGLGFDLDDLSIKDVSVFSKKERHNEGFRIELHSAGVPVVLESYLGDFRLHKDERCLDNEAPVRTLTVATNARTYKVFFDPVPDMERYKAKICIYGPDNSLLETTVVDDDHLSSHLSKIHRNARVQHVDPLLEVENSNKIHPDA
jgi:predicted dehydrogenase